MLTTAYAQVPLVLLAIAALIGAFDVNYYHLWKFRLHARPQSVAETSTHLLRGAIVAAVAILLANFEPRGGYFWLLAGLVGFDFINNVVDVLLEPRSREDLGGVPPMEYLIHVVGATLAGAAGAAALTLGWPLASMSTALAPTTLPTGFVWLGNGLAVGAALSTGFEAFLTLRANTKCCRPPASVRMD